MYLSTLGEQSYYIGEQGTFPHSNLQSMNVGIN